MAFLFKSKKAQQSQGNPLPPATRNVHTSEGAPSTGSPTMANGARGDAMTSQTPTPSGSFSNSLHSATSPQSPDAIRPRQRAESESQVRVCYAVLLSLVWRGHGSNDYIRYNDRSHQPTESHLQARIRLSTLGRNAV
jgi:hypothetical protein